MKEACVSRSTCMHLKCMNRPTTHFLCVGVVQRCSNQNLEIGHTSYNSDYKHAWIPSSSNESAGTWFKKKKMKKLIHAMLRHAVPSGWQSTSSINARTSVHYNNLNRNNEIFNEDLDCWKG